MEFDEALSLREARERFFAENGFSLEQYGQPRVRIRLFGIPCWFPNTAARRRAVVYHDLQHVLTGYDTTWSGESEQAAWELASGCRDFAAAWVLNGMTLVMGLAIAPLRTMRAFRRGLRSRNLYGLPLDDALLDAPVGVLRRHLQLSA